MRPALRRRRLRHPDPGLEAGTGRGDRHAGPHPGHDRQAPAGAEPGRVRRPRRGGRDAGRRLCARRGADPRPDLRAADGAGLGHHARLGHAPDAQAHAGPGPHQQCAGGGVQARARAAAGAPGRQGAGGEPAAQDPPRRRHRVRPHQARCPQAASRSDPSRA